MKIKVTHSDLIQEYNKYITAKVRAIRDVYRKWGKILVDALQQASPEYTGALKRAIRYRTTELKNERGMVRDIVLQVGVIYKKDEKVKKYLKFILYGSRAHFVPQITRRGEYTGILEWAEAHGLVKREGNDWVYNYGRNKGKPATGIYVRGFPKDNDYFTAIYEKYENKIREEILKVLGKE